MPSEATLDGEAKLGASESDQVRWTLINAGPIALGESQSADTVKGGIARAPACLLYVLDEGKKVAPVPLSR